MEDLRFHTGSRVLLPLQDLTGVRVDILNYLFSMFMCLLLGHLYRKYLMTERVSSSARHTYQIMTGMTLLVFCFGHQTVHVLIQSLLCYVMMRTMRPGLVEKLVLAVSLGYVFFSHIHRLVFDYGGFTMDITGPLMINTQCLSALAYSLGDGQVEDKSKLNDTQKKQSVASCPGVLQFTSYVLSFQKVLSGPFFFYKDYIRFVEGTTLLEHITHKESPTVQMCKNLFSAFLCILVVLFIVPLFPIEYLKDDTFANSTWTYKVLYIVAVTTLARFKYYVAWKLSAAVNQSAGMAYNGRDVEGRARWDLTDNVHILPVELELNMKGVLDNWNINTSIWLRHVVYERVLVAPTVASFAVSSVWHGLYPGYYMCMLGMALTVLAFRSARRALRPRFHTSTAKARLYDVITFISTRLGLSYITFPFVLLEFWPSLYTYAGIYFYYHILCILAVIFLPARKSKPKETALDDHGVQVDLDGKAK